MLRLVVIVQNNKVAYGYDGITANVGSNNLFSIDRTNANIDFLKCFRIQSNLNINT